MQKSRGPQAKGRQSLTSWLVLANICVVFWVAVRVPRDIRAAQKAIAASRALPAASCPKLAANGDANAAVQVKVIHDEIVLDRIAIMGERNSGTNAVEQLFKKNVEADTIHVGAGLNQIKHFFQEWPQNGDRGTSRTLILLVVRNPYDWLQSMHKMCYCCEDLGQRKTKFENFLTLQFETTLEHPVSHEIRPSPACPFDLNTYAPEPQKFENVIQARYQKALHWMNMTTWAAGLEVIHWEDVLDGASQEVVFKKIASKWKIRQKGNSFNPLLEDGRFWKPKAEATDRRSTSVYLNPAMRESEKGFALCNAVNSNIDPFMEDVLGYKPVDCGTKHETKQAGKQKELAVDLPADASTQAKPSTTAS